MSADVQLFLVQSVHTLIVALNAAGIGYIIWCGARDRFDLWLWAALALSAGIALALALNDFMCPLQNVARAIVGTDAWVRDLLVPNRMAALIVPVLGPLMALGYALVGWRLLQRRRGG